MTASRGRDRFIGHEWDRRKQFDRGAFYRSVEAKWLGLWKLAEREGLYYRRCCYLIVMPTLPSYTLRLCERWATIQEQRRNSESGPPGPCLELPARSAGSSRTGSRLHPPETYKILAKLTWISSPFGKMPTPTSRS